MSALEVIRISEASAESSALARCTDRAALDAHGFSEAFWSVLDEGPVEQNLVLIGRKSVDSKRWHARRIAASASAHGGRTDDSEALSRYGKHIYVIGSHFGSKTGLLKPKRSFVARFSDEVASVSNPQVEVWRSPFKLHRIINDALRDSATELRVAERARRAYVSSTLERGRKENKAWVHNLRDEDAPINIEGLELLDDGSALIGLRMPVTAHGNPIMVRVAGIPQLFEGNEDALRAVAVYVLADVGSADAPLGIRALERYGETLHGLVGPVPSSNEQDVLLEDYPGTGSAACQHRVITSELALQNRALHTLAIHEFEPGCDVEGLSMIRDGEFVYAIDDHGHIELRLARAPSA
jgi:hypothetical protein